MSRLTRRGFLIGAGSVGLSLSLYQLRRRRPSSGGQVASTEPPETIEAFPDYEGWKDLYRQRWTWDKIAKGTHAVNCWYQRGCNWDVYVKEGLVLREEQSAIITYADRASVWSEERKI